MGLLDPVTKGVTTRGINATERARSKVQWYEPWALEEGRMGTGSFTVPWMTSVGTLEIMSEKCGMTGEVRGPAGRMFAAGVRRKRSGRAGKLSIQD